MLLILVYVSINLVGIREIRLIKNEKAYILKEGALFFYIVV
jgi:hypothetical protein